MQPIINVILPIESIHFFDMMIYMKEQINVSPPLDTDGRKADEVQSTLGLNFDDKLALTKAINILSKKTIEANRKGYHDDASKLADLFRIASMHLDDLESEDRDTY